MSEATFEEQTRQNIQFLVSEVRELKSKVEKHTHNIEQIVREVRRLNEIDLIEEIRVIKERIETIEKKTIPIPFPFERDFLAELDDLKLRLNEIQAKSHRKFAGGGDKGPGSLDNME